MDKKNFANKYNTKLSDKDEKRFQQWIKDISIKQGRNILEDLYDYDMRGAFKEGLTPDNNLHWKDTYKKPNHPTFSTQSIYHNIDGYSGGEWNKDTFGRDTFTPSKTNLYTYDELQNYFNRAEPNALLIEPKLQERVYSDLLKLNNITSVKGN